MCLRATGQPETNAVHPSDTCFAVTTLLWYHFFEQLPSMSGKLRLLKVLPLSLAARSAKHVRYAFYTALLVCLQHH